MATTTAEWICFPPMKLLNLDHIGIAVRDLDAAIDGYRSRYGVEPLYREVVEAQGVEEAMIPVGGSFCQDLKEVLKRNGKVESTSRGGCVFVPLVGKEGWRP